MATKNRKARKSVKPAPLTVQNLTWGAIYTGTPEQLIAARLALPEHFKGWRDGKDVETLVPVDYVERGLVPERGYRPHSATITREWKADRWDVMVRYNHDELDPAKLTEKIAAKFDSYANLLRLMILSDIAPPLSEKLSRVGVVGAEV